jgi:hypothetical protein
MRTMKTLGLSLLILGLAAALPAAKAAAAKKAAVLNDAGLKAPDRLSDLYKIFNQALREGLGAEVQAWPIRIQGRSWELLKDGQFPEVELILKPFQTQDLSFEKAELLFRHMHLDREALLNWKLHLIEVREVESRLIFNMRSLAQKLSKAAGQDLGLKADAEAQTVRVTGKGRFCFIPCTVEADCELKWDDASKQLSMAPQTLYFGGHRIWRWLWWLGRQPLPQGPLLDLGFSWIPFNIQEVHVSWDRVNLTTNW